MVLSASSIVSVNSGGSAFTMFRKQLLWAFFGVLVAAGTYLDPAARRFLAHRLWVLLLLAVGIGAMFGLSAFGGVGGKSGLSWAWALLVVPYVVGWPLGILGPGVPPRARRR